MDDFLTPVVQQQLRQEIEWAAGNEVFGIGRTDSERTIVDLEVLARGNATAVPALLQLCRPGDVVIHNHPSGQLEPSQADLDVAGALGSMGIGFYIVDNRVETLYRVVEAFKPKEDAPVKFQQVVDILGPGGRIQQNLPGYEDRPEQLRMALSVTEALNQHKIALIEAGTGTGKSLAYLIPSILWALSNQERLVVSTNTINLQEQLIRKDLPFLQQATELDFKVVLVKGRSNYLCKRRLQAALAEPGLFDHEHSGEIDSLQKWSESTRDGSREDLTFVPHKSVWDEVCCEADQCNRSQCREFTHCYFHQARREAACADILVVNHALLMADLSLRSQTDNYSALAILPPFSRLIIDEAHHLEDVATRYFSTQVTRFGFARILNRMRHPRKAHQGLLPRLLNVLAKQLDTQEDGLFRQLHSQIEDLIRHTLEISERAVKDLEQAGLDFGRILRLQKLTEQEVRQRLTADIREHPAWPEIVEKLRSLAQETDQLAEVLQSFLKALSRLPEDAADAARSTSVDLAGQRLRLQAMAEQIRIFTAENPDLCTWFEISRSRIGRGEGVLTRLCTAPLVVAPLLRSYVLERMQTTVMTSATLTVGQTFDYLRHRIGINDIPKSRVNELHLASPFDFEKQARLLVVADIPEPGRPGYEEAAKDAIEKALIATGGRTFVLFTAYTMLRRIHGELAPLLSAQGLQVFRQGEATRHSLLKKFIQDPTSILFATDSFWEGVDVPGRALEQVIIARLPFKVPSDPIVEARAESIAKEGKDPFMEFTVPEAVIRFRQGFGRLIRQKTDRGAVLILDSRVVTRGYGRLFLNSLPNVPIEVINGREINSCLNRFFSDNPG